MQNVWATYRKGTGSAGLLDAGRINLLMSRPLGLQAAVNPVRSADAEDPEPLRRARENAPATVQTLDRVVSLQDYEDFSRTFAGISKARATWTWFGEKRGVVITVAGPAGALVSAKGCRLLRSALHAYGDRFVDLRVENYRPVEFRLGLRVKPQADQDPEAVLHSVGRTLRAHYSFDHRAFGEPVTMGEVSGVAQAVAGVQAVQIVRLYRDVRGASPGEGLRGPLVARAPRRSHRGIPHGAELLTLSPRPFDLLEILT
jgi:predicted phage baseplate assembly protein